MSVAIGSTVRLPFWQDGDSDFLDFEVEALVSSPANGEPSARLILLSDGAREKTQQGHFRRSTRSLAEIERWSS